jgi:outer membrane protein assembly factor BamA
MLALLLVAPAARPEGTEMTAPPVGHETTVESSEHFGEMRDFWTRRYEPAGFPIIGGNSDIGFQFGGVGTLTRFEDGVRPYRWNMDLLLTASIKSGTEGTELAQQSYLWQWDLPGMLGGKVRLIPLIYYQRTVNQGYFGLGNASSGADPRAAAGRNYQFIDSEVRVRQTARVSVGGPYQLVVVATFRAESPEAYANTQLARDSAATGDARIYGVRRLGLAMPAVGMIYDSRDFEIYPHRGAFHQIGVKYAQGLPATADVQYGALSTNFAWYMPLGRDFVFATRFATDFQFGHVPFYDLYSGGPFATYDMPGGPSGIRGVPSGRYLGRVKFVGNAELRTLLVDFRLLGTKFRLGGDAFFDTGRVFYDYTFTSRVDGSGLGLKYGTGGGGYLLWGQAALFRVEVAYSPDQQAANPGFPVGIYVEDGVMF